MYHATSVCTIFGRDRPNELEARIEIAIFWLLSLKKALYTSFSQFHRIVRMIKIFYDLATNTAIFIIPVIYLMFNSSILLGTNNLLSYSSLFYLKTEDRKLVQARSFTLKSLKDRAWKKPSFLHTLMNGCTILHIQTVATATFHASKEEICFSGN